MDFKRITKGLKSPKVWYWFVPFGIAYGFLSAYFTGVMSFSYSDYVVPAVLAPVLAVVWNAFYKLQM